MTVVRGGPAGFIHLYFPIFFIIDIDRRPVGDRLLFLCFFIYLFTTTSRPNRTSNTTFVFFFKSKRAKQKKNTKKRRKKMEYPNKTKTQRPNEPFSDTLLLLLLLLLLFNGWQIRSTADEFIMSSGRRRLQAALIMHEMQRLSSTSLSVWIKRRTSFRSTPVECVALVGLVCFVFCFFCFFFI